MFFVRDMTFPKKVNYLLRKYDFLVRKRNFSKNINNLLRKYDLFVEEYAKTTRKWDELIVFEYFLRMQLK